MEDWPLSAAATDLLRRRVRDRSDLLKLALKELVVCGAWKLTKHRGPLGTSRVTLTPTGAAVPARPPLRTVAGRLATATPDGGEVRKVVRKAGTDLSRKAYDDCRAELQWRGLVVREQRLLLGVVRHRPWRRTALGDQWLTDFARLEQDFLAMLSTDPVGAVRAGLQNPALILLAPKASRQSIDRAVNQARDGGYAVGYTGDGRMDDLSALDSFDSLDSLDSGVDGGVDSGGGGDGGGGD